jgi:hypothetical protein
VLVCATQHNTTTTGEGFGSVLALTVTCIQAEFVLCSIALLTRREDSIFYFKLSSEAGPAHSYIGNMALTDTASGVAIRERRTVSTGEYRTRYV